MSSLWSAEYELSGNIITAGGVSWNKELSSQASTTFGFCATRSEDPEPEPEPDPEPVPDPVPGGKVEFEIKITSDWGTGYCANVEITNNGEQEEDWTVTFPAEGNISSLWNAAYVQKGDEVTVEGLAWNNTLKPGVSLQAGFCAVR